MSQVPVKEVWLGELVAPKIPKPMILVIKEPKIFWAHGRRFFSNETSVNV